MIARLAVADTIFDLDDKSLVVLLLDAVENDRLDKARPAAYDCPTDSISWTEEAGIGE